MAEVDIGGQNEVEYEYEVIQTEELLFKMRTKLFQFQKEQNEWTEFGPGTLVLILDLVLNKVSLKIKCDKKDFQLSQLIDESMSLATNVGCERSWIWSTYEYKKTMETVLYAVRFQNIENTFKFKEDFTSAQRHNRSSSPKKFPYKFTSNPKLPVKEIKETQPQSGKISIQQDTTEKVNDDDPPENHDEVELSKEPYMNRSTNSNHAAEGDIVEKNVDHMDENTNDVTEEGRDVVKKIDDHCADENTHHVAEEGHDVVEKNEEAIGAARSIELAHWDDATQLMQKDSALAELPYDTYSKIPSDEVIEKTMMALENKNHNVILVHTREEACEAIKNIVPAGSTVHNSHSTSLEEIGIIDYLKSEYHPWDNLHANVIAESHPHKQRELRVLADHAEYYFTSASAITEDGKLMSVDASGTRVAGLGTAENLIFVSGVNKIVKNYEEGMKRIQDYCLPLESARVRVAYASWGVENSIIANSVTICDSNPFAPPGRITVILVKDALGY